MADKEKIKRFHQNLFGERDGAALYRVMAEVEKNPKLSEVYGKLADVEDKHAKFWEDQIKLAGGTIKNWKPGLRPKILRWLAKRFGPHLIMPLLLSAEKSDSGMYDNQPESKNSSLPEDERSHARILEAIQGGTDGQTTSGIKFPHIESRHRTMGGNALRAAVLGANDGLVSNMSLVMGVAGANMSAHSVLVTGFAGLLAGAISMAIGEWISVQSSRELHTRQLEIEAEELAASPKEEEEELALIYEAKGVPPQQAASLAQHIMQDKTKALDTLAREELGIDPKELGGSALEAALTSFGLFAAGAIIPVLPFLFLSGIPAVITSLSASIIGLFVIGLGITFVTGQSILKSGLRQILFGMAAAAVTFGIGRLVGVNIGG